MRTSELIKSAPFFDGLPQGRLIALANQVTLHSVPRGNIILRANETTESFNLIVSGRAKMIIEGKKGREIILSLLGPGECFGERELFEDLPASVSIKTLQQCRFLSFPKGPFMRCFSEDAALRMR